MPEQYTPNLGNTPNDDARRDAVHIAVAPLVAGVDFRPGDGFYLASDGTAKRAIDRPNPDEIAIGIVDPFLRQGALAGQRFWGFLFPGTVTSLRHAWTHPAFTVKPPPGEPA